MEILNDSLVKQYNASVIKTQLLDVRNIILRLVNLNCLNAAEARGGKLLESLDMACRTMDQVYSELELIDLEIMAQESQSEIVRHTNKRNSILLQLDEKRKL